MKHLTTGRKLVYLIMGLIATSVISVSCSQSSEETASSEAPAEVAAPKYLYMSSGLCYAGIGFTAPAIGTVGKTLVRYNLESLNMDLIRDYADLSLEVSGTFANGIIDGGDGYVYAAVENATATGARRIDKIAKSEAGSRSTFYQNSSVLTTVMKGLSKSSNGDMFLARTSIIDRFDSTPNRKTATVTNAWGQTFGGACATNNTAITGIIALPPASGASVSKFIYSHQTAGQHDIGIIGVNGYVGTTDCLANQATSGTALVNASTANNGWSTQFSTTAAPTAMVYIDTPGAASGTGKLLVAYSSSTLNVSTASGLSNALVMYDINDSAVASATISGGTVLYHDHNYLFGVTAMAYDSDSNMLYVAVSNSLAAAPVGYNIEKFELNIDTPSASRVTNDNGSTFMSANSYNNCVTGMFVGE